MKIVAWIFLGITLLYIIFTIFMQVSRRKHEISQQKHMEDFHKNLNKGDYVLTMSGIYGHIYSIEDKKVSVEIAKGVYVTMDKQTILGVLDSKSN